ERLDAIWRSDQNRKLVKQALAVTFDTEFLRRNRRMNLCIWKDGVNHAVRLEIQHIDVYRPTRLVFNTQHKLITRRKRILSEFHIRGDSRRFWQPLNHWNQLKLQHGVITVIQRTLKLLTGKIPDPNLKIVFIRHFRKLLSVACLLQ